MSASFLRRDAPCLVVITTTSLGGRALGKIRGRFAQDLIRTLQLADFARMGPPTNSVRFRRSRRDASHFVRLSAV